MEKDHQDEGGLVGTDKAAWQHVASPLNHGAADAPGTVETAESAGKG